MRLIDVLHAPWAIKPDRLIEISEIYARHLRGEKVSRETIQMIEAQIGKPLDNSAKGYDVVNGIAVMPVDGVLAKRMNMFTKISGGTSTELLSRDFNAAMSDPGVKGIILNVDSPGGTVDGTQEAASTIYAAKDKKPVCAFCNGMMASAAYWIGSAAQGGIYISGDTVDVGSIGVVTSHTDYSKAYDNMGIKVTELTAGKYKRIASEYGPLTESGRAYIQDQLDHIYGAFLADVGRNRGGMSADQVHEQMADGRIFIGKKAVDAGLVDGVSTLDEMVRQMASGEMPMKKKMPMKQKGIQVVVPENVGAGFKPAQPQQESAPQTAAGDVVAEIEAQEETIMDLKELQEKHPDLYKSVLAEGKTVGIEEGKAQGRTEGAAAEAGRIKAVFEVGKMKMARGHEGLVEAAMFDGKTTAADAKVRIADAHEAALSKKAEDIKKDGQDLVVPPSAAEEAGAKTMKRADFNKLAPSAQASYIQAGGKVTD